MLRRIIQVMILIFISSCGSLKPTFEAGFDTDATRRKKLDSYFTSLTQLQRFNGVVYVQDYKSQPFSKSYTIDSDPASTAYVSYESQFDIHSVSKLIAKAIIIKLEQEGKLKRSDYIHQYIPDFPKGDQITIQHLMDNSSGLPREPKLTGVTKNQLTTDQIVAWAKKETLEFEPGTSTRYSNVGYELLYYIIGQLNNTSFSNYVTTVFFKEIGMADSGAHFYTNKQNLTNWVKNHQLEEELVAVNNITEDDYKQAMLYSTAGDLQLFLRYISQEPYQSALKNNKGIIAWTGGSDGIRAHVQYHVDKKYRIVILANYDEIPLDQILKDIPAILEDRPFEMPKAINREAVELDVGVLSNYQGKYDFVEADHLILEFKVEREKLAVYQEGEKIAELFAENENTFFVDPRSPESFEFKKVAGRYQVVMGWKGVKLQGTRLE